MTGSNETTDPTADGADPDPASATVSIEAIGPEKIDRVEALLDQNDLPYRDIRNGPDDLVGAVADGDLVGVGGLERYETVGLLRSLAVEESARGQGLGTRVCDELETRAREAGVETLYLLTTTAAEFFDARGYTEVDRSEAPPAIQETTEFQDLCPSTAVCMRKDLR